MKLISRKNKAIFFRETVFTEKLSNFFFREIVFTEIIFFLTTRTYGFVELHANNGMLMALVLPGAVAKFSDPTFC